MATLSQPWYDTISILNQYTQSVYLIVSWVPEEVSLLCCGLLSNKNNSFIIYSSSYFHWKLLMGGVILILLDSLMNFRLEYLYPVVMFIRSVYDSYKYQGFVSDRWMLPQWCSIVL